MRSYRLIPVLCSLVVLGAMALPGTADAATPMVASGRDYSCVVTSQARLQCWGDNSYGVIGNGTWVWRDFYSTPSLVKNLSGVSKVSASAAYVCALKTDGTVWCWGDGYEGRVGNGNNIGSKVPVQVSGLTGATDITVGGSHSCAIVSPGTVKCWGRGAEGQFGNNSVYGSYTPVSAATGVSTATKIVSSQSSNTTCVLLSSGGVKCWGPNNYGMVGDNTITTRLTPTTVLSAVGVSLAGVTNITAGVGHFCALLSTQTVKCWGNNDWGQLGDGTSVYKKMATAVSGSLSGITTIAAGNTHTCAAKSSATYCWGGDYYGQLGNLTSVNQLGSATANTTPITVPGLTGVTSLGSGLGHACAVVADSTAKCWGNLKSQFSSSSADLSPALYWTDDVTAPLAPTITPPATRIGPAKRLNFVASESGGMLEYKVDSGDWTACTSMCVYSNDASGYYTPSGLVDGSHTLVVRQTDSAGNVSGSSSSVGFTYDGTAPLSPTITAINETTQWDSSRAVAFTTSEIGGTTTCEIDGGDSDCTNSSGTAGSFIPGALSEESHSVRVTQYDEAGNSSSASISFTVDNTPPEKRSLDSGPSLVSTSSSARFSFAAPVNGAMEKISAGGSHTCALYQDNKARCWGRNTNGQLGNSTFDASKIPAQVAGLTGATAISAGYDHTCALLASKAVQCWGGNSMGQLGNQSWDDSNAPSIVSALSNVQQISAGQFATCAVITDGTIKCWGDGENGQLGDGTWDITSTPVTVSGISNATQVSVGSYSSCAVLADSTVQCWGDNDWGLLGAGTWDSSSTPVTVSGISNATQVSVGDDSACALLADGSAQCWGGGGRGVLGDNNTGTDDGYVPVTISGLSNATQVSVGESSACALLAGGSAKCWGTNSSSGLSTTTPTSVGGVSAATQISLTSRHSCVLLADNNGKCWGNNNWGQLGDYTKTNSSTPTQIVAAEPNTGTRCSVDDSNYSAATECTSSYNVVGLADGSHTMRLWNADQAGNHLDPTTYTWTIDTAVPLSPTIAQIQTPNNHTSGQTIDFTTAEAGGSVQCKLDSGSYENCTTYSGTSGTYVIVAVAAGSHTVAIKQTDDVGHTSAASSMTWTVDVTAPATPAIDQLPTPTNITAGQTINFDTAEAGGTVQCKLDSGSYENCTTYSYRSGTYDTGAVAEGLHTFMLKQTDAAGNTSAARSMAWSVDATAPSSPSITQAPDSQVYSDSVSIAWTKDDATTSWCQLDAQAWATCSSPKNITKLAAGAHSLKIKSVDGANNTSLVSQASWNNNNTSSSPAVSDFDVAPAVATLGRADLIQNIGRGKTVYTNSKSLTYLISFVQPVSGLGVNDFVVKGTAKKWVVKSVVGSGAGPYTITLANTIQTTGTLNVSINPRTVLSAQGGLLGPAVAADADSTVMSDQTIPAAPVLAGIPKTRTAATSLAITISAEPNALVQCSLDAQDYTDCSSPWVVDQLADGQHNINIRQIDQAGNTGAIAKAQWLVHTANPAVPTIIAQPASQNASAAASVWFSGEAKSSFTCKVDQTEWSECASSFVAENLANGDHQIQVRQTNELGKTSDPALVNWTTTLPETAGVFRTFVTRTLTKLNCNSNVPIIKSKKTQPGTIGAYYWLSEGKVVGSGKVLLLSPLLWGKNTTCIFATRIAGASNAYASDSWNQALPRPALASAISLNRSQRIATAEVVRWNYGPVTTTYQWFKNGVSIEGATSASYAWTAQDAGQIINCVITLTNPSGATQSNNSFKAF